ncbi:hypothetical protein [Streptomyces sp. H27-D2]|uniref:hypothetical protein n=1 Tax=Streptomyces sp. H27-D2 TaxID=3046304 RepID=UPI002DBEA56C|nr:hypothetical protein [Streptomyces sp. H27-D2]MEC4015627.1 hypothetical protein [Streptomyces sp. H27-D2]
MFNRTRHAVSCTDERGFPTMGSHRSPEPARPAFASHHHFGCERLATAEVV